MSYVRRMVCDVPGCTETAPRAFVSFSLSAQTPDGYVVPGAVYATLHACEVCARSAVGRDFLTSRVTDAAQRLAECRS